MQQVQQCKQFPLYYNHGSHRRLLHLKDSIQLNPKTSETLRQREVEINWTRPWNPLKAPSKRSPHVDQVTSFNNLLHYSPLCYTSETKVERQRILRHSLTAEMGSAALKAGGSEALPPSRLPGNCCYATAESPPIKAQRVARWGRTAPRRSKHLWGATLSKAETCMTTLPPLSIAGVLLRMVRHAYHI